MAGPGVSATYHFVCSQLTFGFPFNGSVKGSELGDA